MLGILCFWALVGLTVLDFLGGVKFKWESWMLSKLRSFDILGDAFDGAPFMQAHCYVDYPDGRESILQ